MNEFEQELKKYGIEYKRERPFLGENAERITVFCRGCKIEIWNETMDKNILDVRLFNNENSAKCKLNASKKEIVDFIFKHY